MMITHNGIIGGDLFEIWSDKKGWHIVQCSLNGQAIEPRKIKTLETERDIFRFADCYFHFCKGSFNEVF